MFRAPLKVWLGSCLSTAFQKIHSMSTGGAHSRVLAYIASYTSPPYLGKQLTVLFHTQPLLKYLVYSIAAPMVKLLVLVKAQDAQILDFIVLLLISAL